ncbi:Zinc finger protein 488 [Plecturocebus cupreus]
MKSMVLQCCDPDAAAFLCPQRSARARGSSSMECGLPHEGVYLLTDDPQTSNDPETSGGYPRPRFRVSSPVSQGALPSHGSLLGHALQNSKLPKTDSRQSSHLAHPVALALLITMAAGKGAPSSSLAENRWQFSEPELGWGHKPVLLEKTNCLAPEAAVGRAELALSAASGKPRSGQPLTSKARGEQRQSAFTELPRMKDRCGDAQAQERDHDDPAGQPGTPHLAQAVPRDPAGSTVFSVWPSGARGEQRSAFSKPTKRPAERPAPSPGFPAGESADTLRELSRLFNTADLPCWG